MKHQVVFLRCFTILPERSGESDFVLAQLFKRLTLLDHLHKKAGIVKHQVVFLRCFTFYLSEVVSPIHHYNLELLMHAGAQDYKHEVDPDLLDYADSNYGTKSSLFSSLFGDYANRLREDYSIPTPTTVDDAILLYFLLISDMNDMIS